MHLDARCCFSAEPREILYDSVLCKHASFILISLYACTTRARVFQRARWPKVFSCALQGSGERVRASLFQGKVVNGQSLAFFLNKPLALFRASNPTEAT